MNEGTEDRIALEAVGLGKQYRSGWALRACGFRIPAGRICGLVGPNGAGKSTLLGLAASLLTPTEGEVRVFGRSPEDPEARTRVAYLAQGKPLYSRFRVEEMLRLGAELNPGWDGALADRIVAQGSLDRGARIGSLSGGQRTRVALALALGKRPDLLRRVLPAIAVTGVLLAAVELLMLKLRPHLYPMVHQVQVANPDFQIFMQPHNAWLVSWGYVLPGGQQVAAVGCGPERCTGSLPTYGYFHPVSHFVPIQLIETGILLVLTAGLVALAFRLLKRD